MNAEELLRGSCSCGRYHYVIHIPADTSTRREAHIHFGTGELDHRSHSSLLSAWLRVPLTWYQSATVAQFPDERHYHIARTFTPLHQPGCQRKFCGFCGTNISYWTEQPSSEQDFMNITLGSLRSRDLQALENLDLLPEEVTQEASSKQDEGLSQAVKAQPLAQEAVVQSANEPGLVRSTRSGNTGGISWFESLIQGSQLGHHSKRRRGHGVSADGTTTVDWEVSEYFDDEEEVLPGSKRRNVQLETEDTSMKD